MGLRTAALLLALALPIPAARALQGPPEPPPPKDVSLETGEEGVKLAATLYEPAGGGEGKPAILALHPEGGDRSLWAATGRLCAEHGMTLLALDLRGHGGSRTLDGEDLGPRAAAQDPELWKAMGVDVEAGLRWLRGTLLADGKRIGIAGAGAGAGLALMAAEKDAKVRACWGVGPEPAACGLPGMASAFRWDDRPVGFVVAEADAKGDAAALERQLGKHPRTDVVVLPLDGRRTPAELLATPRAAAETAQFFLGWFDRPVLTGRDERGVSHGGGIFVSGSSYGVGTGAGGLRFEGYYAPGRITALQVLVDPDPAATRLTKESRRITVVPAPGKEPALSVLVEQWTGSGWKRGKPFPILEAGAFVADGKTTFYQVLLLPSVLGVPPFSRIAVQSAAVVDGATKWPGKDEVAGFGPDGGKAPFSPVNPSTWQSWELR